MFTVSPFWRAQQEQKYYIAALSIRLLGAPLPKKISLKLVINNVRFFIPVNVREYGEYTCNFRSYF